MLAALVLVVAYVSLAVYVLLLLADRLTAWTLPPFAGLAALLAVNSALFLWRLAMRFGFVARACAGGEGAAVAAAHGHRQHYCHDGRAPRPRPLPAGRSQWDKTGHHFPDELPAE